MTDDIERAHTRAVQEILDAPGRVFVVGGVDTGKTTFIRQLVHSALQQGHHPAIIDADLGQSTIGPPTTVGLKIIHDEADLDVSVPDAMGFVGSDSPRGHLLPLVVSTARLVMRAIEMGARLIVVDTSGLIGGVAGQVLKLAKAELCRPHHVVGLEQGGELEPIISGLRHVLPVNVLRLGVHPDVRVRSVDERAAYRERGLAAFLGPDASRWRVRPTLFLPMLPPGFDLAKLDGLLVGVDDGAGDCQGLGILEFSEDTLRLSTPAGEGLKALRLGSLRVTPDGRTLERLDIRTVFATD